MLDEHAITHVVHLAALQVPFCRADPPLGARVNVVGTVNVFEAVARRRDRIAAPVVYASSVAAYDALDEGEDHAKMVGVPSTLYGVYKRANEGTAMVYAEERDTGSVGLRPHTVYGPGRDQGLTSAPTVAMLHAAAGKPYTLPFGGAYQLQYAPDVAAAFVAAARSEGAEGAALEDVGGETVRVEEVIAAIEAASPGAAIDHEPVVLPFPSATGGGVMPTSLEDGVADTIARFRVAARARPRRALSGSELNRFTDRGPVTPCGLRSGALQWCSRKVSGLRSGATSLSERSTSTPGAT